MAIDESLMLSVAAGAPPTLRFYGWSKPTLSLGYFQSHRDVEAFGLDGTACELVRRSTGGGAILHEHEITYSVALPMTTGETGAREIIYRQTHDAIAVTLATMGVSVVRFADLGRRWDVSAEPFLCFQRRTAEDLIVAGYKIVGSAQRRTRGAILQHGSILLSTSDHAPQLPGVAQFASAPVNVESLVSRIAGQLSEMWGWTWRRGELSADEIAAAGTISGQRYGNPEWTERR